MSALWDDVCVFLGNRQSTWFAGYRINSPCCRELQSRIRSELLASSNNTDIVILPPINSPLSSPIKHKFNHIRQVAPAPPVEYDWTICLWWSCGLVSCYFDHLLLLHIVCRFVLCESIVCVLCRWWWTFRCWLNSRKWSSLNLLPSVAKWSAKCGGTDFGYVCCHCHLLCGFQQSFDVVWYVPVMMRGYFSWDVGSLHCCPLIMSPFLFLLCCLCKVTHL